MRDQSSSSESADSGGSGIQDKLLIGVQLLQNKDVQGPSQGERTRIHQARWNLSWISTRLPSTDHCNQAQTHGFTMGNKSSVVFHVRGRNPRGGLRADKGTNKWERQQRHSHKAKRESVAENYWPPECVSKCTNYTFDVSPEPPLSKWVINSP